MVMEKYCKRCTFLVAIGTILILFSSGLAGAAESGNRIWQEGMPASYTWNSYSFAGFYYNLNDNLGTEELTIHNIKRNIAKGDLVYKSSPMEVSFEYFGFGKYQVIGFMADKYFVGYTTNSAISGNDRISVLSSSQLHKVILDDEDKRLINEGGTLTLKEGYVLKMTEVDISAGPGQIWVTLLKNGVEVDSDVVSGNDNYVYSTTIGSAKEVPLLAIHFDSVFRGREVNVAFVRGVFQISESFIPVKVGDRYGELEISGIGSQGIEMSNQHSIGLSRGNTIDLVGDLKIIVADSDTLRFALSVEKTGAFEVRGTVYPETDEWTPFNFGLNVGGTNIGFYYDMDNDVGKENLKIEQISGNSIPRGKLRYSTSPDEVSFEYSGFGKYQVIGFMADRYFAGYTANSEITNRHSISVFETTQLHKVLLDDDTKRMITSGSTLTLKEGYVVKMKDVDIGAGQAQILIGLLKDGNEIDTDVVSGEDSYIYIPSKVGNVSELPIIAVHFDSVFRGREIVSAFVRGVFQISENYITLTTDDTYGQMEVESIDRNGINMTNKNFIGLSSGGTVDLMGNIKLKMADSSVARFYPFVEVTPEMIASQLLIDAPAKATAGDAMRVRVTAGGKAVEGVTVGINSEIGNTDKNGIFDFTIEKTLKTGTYNLTASKLGYQKTSKNILIEGYLENRLIIDAPAKANQFEEITIKVTNRELPVGDVTVAFDNVTVGKTDSTGMLDFTLLESGLHTIYASKSGLTTGARDIEIKVPFSEYRALDISVPDAVYSNREAVFLANITNVGTKNDTLPVVLIVNNTEVDSIPVTLAPKEVKEVEFKSAIDLPAGNYTVEVLGQKKPVEVREPGINVFLVLGVIIVIGAIIIYLLTAKGKPVVENEKT
jgi:S-layer protein (TIGR01567 family)